jgi:hypothetical protein
MFDLGGATIQAILFALFAGLTAILSMIIAPTYDNLLVPELAPAALYPGLPPSPSASSSFLSGGAAFSSYLVANVVDPLVGLVGIGVALAYLGRSFLGRWATRAEPLIARLVLSVLLANFTLPIAGAILDVAGSMYPVIAGFDGGQWQHWQNLAGSGELAFSWDNGALAFVLTFVLFTVVLLLASAVALRNALLAVLLVLLPLFTLVWPIPTLAPLARRAWLWFGELAFLPCVLVIPLELAVGAPSVLLLLGFLTVALASPAFLSVAGSQLQSVGFPSAGAAVSGGVQRGLMVASRAAQGVITPFSRVATLSPGLQRGIGIAGRAVGSTAFPGSIPVLAGEFLGHGTAHLFQHLSKGWTGGAGDRFPSAPGPSVGGTRRV